MKRQQNSFDNQNSDEMGSKDNLVVQGAAQSDPYRAKASEFSVKSVTPANGQGVDGGGKDSLVPQSTNQLGPRHVQDSVTRSDRDSMQENASSIASNFSVSTNQGESSSSAASPELAESIDCCTGRIVTKGYKSSPLQEVSDKLVSLG